MKLSRRSFLFGSTATLGVIALAPYLEPIAFQDAEYKKRLICAMSIGGAEDSSEEPIHVALKRWPICVSLFNVSVHPKAAYSWRMPPGQELVFVDKSLMLLEATGCPSQVEIVGNDDGVSFVERYRFPSGSKERWLLS